MADIDKTLPNVKRPEEEVAEVVNLQEEVQKGPIEITEDDTGATIDFDPSQVDIPDEGDPFANLNELLPEDETSKIGNQLQNDFREYKVSRAEWERAYIVGLDLLGFKYSGTILSSGYG